MTAAITARRLAAGATADPALGYPAPDTEALVWSAIRHLDEDPGAEVRSWAFAAYPVPSPRGWAVAVSIQVDVRDASKAAAFRRADDARRILLGLPFVAWADGVVNDVQITGGPSWLPDLGSGRPRYTTQAVVQVHPARQGGTA